MYNINKINTKKKVCSKIQNRIMNLWRNNIIVTISEQRLKCVERKISLVGIMSVREKRHWSFRMVNVTGLEEEKDGGILKCLRSEMMWRARRAFFLSLVDKLNIDGRLVSAAVHNFFVNGNTFNECSSTASIHFSIEEFLSVCTTIPSYLRYIQKRMLLIVLMTAIRSM